MTVYSVFDADAGKSGGYGIKITKERVVKNISNKYSVVKKIADVCNKEGLDFDQFDDVLENFLGDRETF